MALARAGRHTPARDRLAEAECLAGMWQGGPWQAAVWDARGMLRRTQGDAAQAIAFYKEAATQFADVGRPRDERRCLEAAVS